MDKLIIRVKGAEILSILFLIFFFNFYLTDHIEIVFIKYF